jgi:hypothetical protein
MKKIWMLYALFVIIAMAGFELIAGATYWWQHIIYLLLSLWLGGAVGGIDEPVESSDGFHPYP